MIRIFLVAVLLFTGLTNAKSQDVAKCEYLTVRVQYGENLSGYVYEVFVDIGTSGSHSLSGQVTNLEKSVVIVDDHGKYEFKSDIDLLNYFGKKGWRVVRTGEIDILDQHYYTYLLERCS